MARKNKIPVFVFTAANVLGKKLIAENILHDVTGARIISTSRYDCERDCNGIRIKRK